MSLNVTKSIVRAIAGLIFSGALALSCSSKDDQTTVSAAPSAAPAADAPAAAPEFEASQPVAPSKDGLNLDPSTSANRLSGSYRSGETVLYFDSYRLGDVIRFKLSKGDGAPLVELSNSAAKYTMSFRRDALTLTADASAVKDAGARQGHEQDVGVPQQAEAAEVRSVGDTMALPTTLASAELALLPALSRSLGEAGYAGFKSAPALTLHRFALFREQGADSVDTPELPSAPLQSELGEVPYCENLSGNINHNDCYGMCGRGCSCWSWVCGDCCYHRGCALHDDQCRKCSWRNPVACTNCYSNIIFFVTVAASC